MDEKTKEILKTWPLTTVKRWAASPNVFTLDFGDYQDQYYSVQTTEGEHISALIAGYIDIILKRRQRKERFGEDGNEEEAMEESFISPGRAIEIHGLPQTLKKAKPDSLAHPGVFRNSGREYLLFYLINSFDLFYSLFLICFFILSFFQPKRLISMGTPPRKSPLLQMGIKTEDLILGYDNVFSYVSLLCMFYECLKSIVL